MDDIALVRERVRGVEVRVDDLEKWQAKQNGSIHRVEDDVKEIKRTQMSMVWGVAISAFGAIGSLGVGIILYLMNR